MCSCNTACCCRDNIVSALQIQHIPIDPVPVLTSYIHTNIANDEKMHCPWQCQIISIVPVRQQKYCVSPLCNMLAYLLPPLRALLGFLTSGMTDCSSCVFYLLIHATCFCIWQSFTSHGADDSLSASQPCELKPWGQMRLYLCWMITHGLPKDIHTVTNMQINWCYSHTNTEINKLKSWFLSINDFSFYLYLKD